MESLDKVIKRVIGIREDAGELTPMDKGECKLVAEEWAAIKVENLKIKLFDPEKNKPKPSKDDITLSEDVCIIDENNLHGIAYYNFESNKWKFHTDTLVDYDEIGEETKWMWYYPPVDASMITK